MSLNNIQFSSYLCHNLYAKSLILTKEISNTSTGKIEISSLGGNQKKVLFLVNNAENKFLDNDEMTLLTNLITACQLSMEDIALVNYFTYDKLNYKTLVDYFQSEKILLFGISATEMDLPFIIPNFQIQSYDKKLFMAAPALSEFIDNKDLKKNLWVCLQKIFLNK